MLAFDQNMGVRWLEGSHPLWDRVFPRDRPVALAEDASGHT